ncbi:hypothetical protein EDL99_07065 [Ornithobacterium rhinotracheale]|nr:hypothetical protein [Ornithobacterium rhinotracheale]
MSKNPQIWEYTNGEKKFFHYQEELNNCLKLEQKSRFQVIFKEFSKLAENSIFQKFLMIEPNIEKL